MLLGGACGGVPDRASAPADTARRFYAAIGRGDAPSACALLAPQTRIEFEHTAGRPCPAAVLKAVPGASRVRASSGFGSHAQVRLVGDVVFLAQFSGGWRIVAAGCTPRPPLPHDCQIEGV
jgi:hypothetical protein